MNERLDDVKGASEHLEYMQGIHLWDIDMPFRIEADYCFDPTFMQSINTLQSTDPILDAHVDSRIWWKILIEICFWFQVRKKKCTKNL
jgi:hypothetical protein